ncbi:TetR/AcrR family transcriptional regulator [Litoribacillus peritrichatus]|uniref:HTH tetR-type domain-containing protein n=1 Tax=Litoribacillus peritrichatus TaxID=718191 RepID=A0ABP7MB24_9GAMM
MTEKEPKSTYHKVNLRESLITEAARMIQEEGVASVTLRGLGQRLDVSRTAPYRHFEDKTDLLCAVSEYGFTLFRQALETERLSPGVRAISRFQNMGRAYIHFALENTSYYSLMFREPTVVDHQTASLKAAGDAALNELKLILEECQNEGLVAQENLDLQAMFVWSGMHGYCSLLLDKYQGEEGELSRMTEYMVSKVLQGVSKH